MARRPTYGERMAEWERTSDEREWNNSLQRAWSSQNFEELDTLIKEGIQEEYSFSQISDPNLLKLVKQQL